jgi:hypothetical protein
MRALRNHLVLFVTIGLALGVVPAVASAHVAQAARPAAHHGAAALPVTLKLSTDSIKVGHTFGATGAVSDAAPGTQVRLQRGAGGTWTTVATTQTTSTAGAFALKNVIASVEGAYLYRAVAGPGTTKTSAYSWMIVTAKKPPTIVSGFVEAGGPVAGSAVKIFAPGRIKPVATAVTTRYGYFLARIPKLPKNLLVVATGGIGPIGRFHGTMTSQVPHPNAQDAFHLNPATTLVAAYLADHPQASRATGWRKIRDLLGLKRYHNLDWALGGRPSYFDSVKFLRTARRHGGFDKYVGHLVGQIDKPGASAGSRRTSAASGPVFPATSTKQLRAGSQGVAIAGLIGEEASGYLGVAAQGASVINGSLGLMNLVGSLVGWSPSGGPTPGQMMSAIDQVQSTLTAIETQLANLSSDLNGDFDELKLQIDQTAYGDRMTGTIQPAYDEVAQVHNEYEQYIQDQDIIAMCVPAPSDPSAPLVAPAGDCPQPAPLTPIPNKQVVTAVGAVQNDLNKFGTGASNLELLLDQGDSSSDVFHNALRSTETVTPAIVLLRNVALDESGQVFLPATSSAMQNFAATVLTNQSQAYYLTMVYENFAHGTSSVSGAKISQAYLGDYADYINGTPYDPTQDPLDRPIPTSGNLNLEMTYLQAILPVPAGAAVDANAGGLMYLSTDNVGLASMFLPADAASRADCIALVTFNGGKACQALTDPLTDLNVYMSIFPEVQGWQWASSEPGPQSGPPGTYSNGLTTGWGLVSQGDLGTMLPRLAGVQDVNAEYYYNPGPVNYGGGDDIYWVLTSDGSTLCTDPYVDPNSACAGESEGISDGYGVPYVLDWLKLYFKLLDGSDFTCTWAVGQANTNSDPCFDMPALIARPLLSGEDYVPQ